MHRCASINLISEHILVSSAWNYTVFVHVVLVVRSCEASTLELNDDFGNLQQQLAPIYFLAKDPSKGIAATINKLPHQLPCSNYVRVYGFEGGHPGTVYVPCALCSTSPLVILDGLAKCGHVAKMLAACEKHYDFNIPNI